MVAAGLAALKMERGRRSQMLLGKSQITSSILKKCLELASMTTEGGKFMFIVITRLHFYIFENRLEFKCKH